MDIEKLKSIIRLANNNPNDNEANLAARKACKILAENDFAIFNGHAAYGGAAGPGKTRRYSETREPEVSVADIFEEMMRKQREAANRNAENARRKAEEARKRTEEQKKEQHRRNWENPFRNPFDPFRTRPESDFRSKFWADPEWFENETRERQERKQKTDKELYQRCSKCRNMAWGPKPFTSHLTGELKEFTCHTCLGTQYTKGDSQYKKKSHNKKICPRCGFPIYFNFEQRIYKCDNAICNMVITEQEWANIGK